MVIYVYKHKKCNNSENVQKLVNLLHIRIYVYVQSLVREACVLHTVFETGPKNIEAVIVSEVIFLDAK